MFQLTMRKIAITGIVTLLLTPLLAFNGDWIWSQPTDGSIQLQSPPFFHTAQAQGTTFFDEEAGIAAYFNAGRTIDINSANLQSLYRSPVTPEDGYLLGSAIVTETHPDLDYSGDDDVKLYISQEGWIMAYYHRSAPTSKIFDFLNWDGSGNLSTKLEQVLRDSAFKVSAPQSTPTYYHFAFPDANRMMLIADDFETNTVDTNSFNVNPPITTGFEYFEWSWSLGSLKDIGGAPFYDTFRYILNDTEIAQVEYGSIKNDVFSGPQPLLGQTNIVTIKADSKSNTPHGVSGLAIIYKVP